ncbi:MAG: BtrH N-terminal domain-containing protein, partial [Aggregatilineales bacterium]
MPVLDNYTQFDGRYPDTGVIRNVLDYQGAKAPHTGHPYTEAMLLGISGGVAFGYFTFHYAGYDPQVNLLTRNTFEPMQTIMERMAIPREIFQTTSADKGRENLIRALEDGHAPIVWADMYYLPYNAEKYNENNWGTFPIVVYGYNPETGEVNIADRSFTGLTTTTRQLDTARSCVKKDKQKLMLLEHPDESRLPDAVRAGIMDCITLMTEKPPRGSARNFGLKALQ